MDKEFKWTDELALEFVNYSLKESPTMQGRYSDLEDFKKSKTKEVKPIVESVNYDVNEFRFRIIFRDGKTDTIVKTVSKERLAEILINEDRGLLCFVTVALEEDIEK